MVGMLVPYGGIVEASYPKPYRYATAGLLSQKETHLRLGAEKRGHQAPSF